MCAYVEVFIVINRIEKSRLETLALGSKPRLIWSQVVVGTTVITTPKALEQKQTVEDADKATSHTLWSSLS